MGNRVTEGYLTTQDFVFELDLDNITRGIQDWQKVINAIDVGTALGELEFADRMKSKMIERLNYYGLGGSEIVNSITIDNVGDDGIYIRVGTDYAIYVEYGTGIVGSWNPHPKPWEYDINGHSYKGWYYPTTESDPNPYKHVYNGQLYGFTRGMESRPFMYDTWIWGRRSFTQIIRKNINREIKKVRSVK